MTDRTQRLAIIVTAQDLAAGKLKNVRSELAQMGTSGRLAAIGLGGAMLAVNKGEQALGHLKMRLTSLAGPLGFGALIGGALGISGALTQGIERVDSMALAVEKLTTVTDLNVHQASQLLAVGEKYGVSNEQIVKSAGMAEKILGKLASTTAAGGKASKSAALQQLELEKAQRQAHGQSTKNISLLISEQKGRDQLTAAMANAVDGTTKLADLDKKYGLNLIDNKGKVVDYATELNQIADLYQNKLIPVQTADYVASQLLGKSYLALVPVLRLGSKGIAEAAAEADKLGLTLKSAQDVKNVHDFIAAQREAKDALAGTEVQLGLMVMPDLTAGFRMFTGYLVDHQVDVKAFFANGLHMAEGFASFVSGTVIPTVSGLATVATGFWNSIPGPLRDFMIKGIVADRTIKFLFGMSPIHFIADLGGQALGKALGGSLGGLFARGSSPANPMYVAGAGLGGPGGVTGAAGGAGSLLKFIGAIGLATVAIDLWQNSLVPLNNQIAQQTTDIGTGVKDGLKSVSADQLKVQRAALTEGLNKIVGMTNNLGPLQGILYGGQIEGLKADILKINQELAYRDTPGNAMVDAYRRQQGMAGHPGKEADDLYRSANALTTVSGTLTALQEQLHADFRDAIGALRKATDPAAILAAAKRITEDIWKGVGSGRSTKATISELASKRDALLAAGDKAGAAIIAAEMRKIALLVPGREHQAALLAQGQKIVASSESAKQKIVDLHRIEATLLSEHRTTAAAAIQKQIDTIAAINAVNTSIVTLKPGQTVVVNSSTGFVTGATDLPKGPAPTPIHIPGKPHRQGGGPVWRDHDYIVGEKGPELFRPRRDGLIVPASSPYSEFGGIGPQRSWDARSGISKGDWGFTHQRVPTVGNFGRASMPHEFTSSIVAAIRQGMAGARVQVAARTVTRATAIDSRYSNRPLAGVTVD